MTEKTPMSDFIGVPLEDLPKENPPVSLQDLSYGDRQPETLFTMPDMVAENPKLMPLWTSLVEAARQINVVKVDGTDIVHALTADLIAKRIERSRERYFEGRERFWKMINGHEENRYYFNCELYCKAENIEYDPEFQGATK